MPYYRHVKGWNIMTNMSCFLISANGQSVTLFLKKSLDSDGNSVVSQGEVNRALAALGYRRGNPFSIVEL